MLTIEGIAKNYKKRTVLTDVSLQADAGMMVGILGKNGSGKSTLLSILAGVNKADRGRFQLDAVDLLTDTGRRNQCCAYVPQENPLIGELSARDNLRMWYDKRTMEQSLQNGFLKLLGIDEFLEAGVNQMSGGMKKRLSIGCAIYANPKVLLLDEPTASLDIICREVIYDYLDAFRKNGGIVLLATHEEKEIRMCDTLYVMKDGVSVLYSYTGDVQELIRNF